MSADRGILEGVELSTETSRFVERAQFHKALGFLTLQDPQNNPRTVSVIAFGVPGWQQGTDELPQTARSTTNLEEIEPELQVPERQLKGVGMRLYNTPQALGGTAENYPVVGAYRIGVTLRRLPLINLFDHRTSRQPNIDPGLIYDGRRLFDYSLRLPQRIHEYNALKKLAEEQGLEAAVAKIHKQQGITEFAIYSQTPDGILKQRQRKQAKSTVREAFMVVRNSFITATKVGEYHRV